MRRERLAKISDLIFMGGGRASPRLLNPLPTFTGPISNEVEVSIRLPRSVVAKEQKEKKKKKILVSGCLSRFAGILIEKEEQGGREQRPGNWRLVGRWSGAARSRN